MECGHAFMELHWLITVKIGAGNNKTKQNPVVLNRGRGQIIILKYYMVDSMTKGCSPRKTIVPQSPLSLLFHLIGEI